MASWSFKEWAPSSSTPASSSVDLRQFSLAEIKKATNNFDQSLLLRSGWSIEVYKGTYDDHDGTQKTVAIKCINFESSWELALIWFEQERDTWSQYHHKNVVSVIGYCQEPPNTSIIVYEYMPNGSLANHLLARITPTSFSFSWEQCLEICIDAARGLEYMHTNIRYSNGNSFVHSDVTATSILLDGNGVAKISDLYKEPFTVTGSHESACYFDPECHSTGNIFPSSDVYAFGVLLVKVLSRKLSFDKEDRNLGRSFKKIIARCIENGTIHHIVHPEMIAQISPDCSEAFLHIAGECLNNESEKRPSFTQVVKKLEFLMAPSSSSSQRLCHSYSLHDIEDITNNFKSILGEGGEGKVYNGLTKTNINVAVKRLKPDYSSEFQKEIEMLSNLEHPNLVSLVGFCHESDENILIYEFVCNGTLAQNLYGRGASSLSWNQRLNICIGAARGLRYLHTGTNSSRKGIIHRDVKPVNILLDENFNAKISDFGLSKMGPQDQANSEIATMVKGTTGYYAPEYQRYGKITRRIDVYAFGVVLSEVLCRKKPWDREESFYPTENEKYGKWAMKNIDLNLNGMIAPACLEAFTDILEKCLNLNPNRRPTMNDVVSVLEYAQEWQEAWQRHKSGGYFYLPGCEDRVVFYYTSNSQEFSRSIKIRLPLRKFAMHLDERDLRKDFYLKEFKHVFGNTVDIRMPQLFVRGNYIGDANEVEKLYETGELAKLLGVSPPQFICDSCGEEGACGVCKRTSWYTFKFVHCKNCDALMKVWKQWEGKLRSCLECDKNELICSASTETRPGQSRSYLARGADFLASMFQ